MQYLGFFLLVVAFCAAIFGIRMRMKAKKLLSAPFHRTGAIAQNPSLADSKGLVSCEGAVQAQQPTIAPCSGRPCVYFEIEVKQSWQKHVVTENGSKTEKGTTSIHTEKGGSVFWLNDGSGPLPVDPSQGMEVELDKVFEQGQNVAYGTVVFGQFQTNVPAASGDKLGTGVTAVEKIVPAEGNMFVMGKLQNGGLTKPDGMLGKLLASRKGRDALIGGTKKYAMFGFIGAGVAFAPGLGMAIFCSPPAPSENALACKIVDQTAPGVTCNGSITTTDGYTTSFTATKPATYTFLVKGKEGAKYPLFPVVTLTDSTGKVLGTGEDEGVVKHLEAGTYSINIKEKMASSLKTFKGGFSFFLSVKQQPDPVVTTSVIASASATATSVTPVAKAPAAKGGSPAAKTNSTAAHASAAATTAKKPAAPAALAKH